MAAENRAGTRGRYFYKAKRKGDKVKKEYVGSMDDPTVAIAARYESLQRAETRAIRRAKRSEAQAIKQVEKLLQLRRQQFRVIVRAWCQLSGYRLLDNGELKQIIRVSKKDITMPENISLEGFALMAARAEKGDTEALADLRRTLFENREEFRSISDLTAQAKKLLISMLAEHSLVLRESLEIELAELLAKLSVEDESPIRRLAVEEVVICWLDLRFHQLDWASREGHTPDLDTIHVRWSRANQRYTAALRNVATISKIERTPVGELQGS